MILWQDCVVRRNGRGGGAAAAEQGAYTYVHIRIPPAVCLFLKQSPLLILIYMYRYGGVVALGGSTVAAVGGGNAVTDNGASHCSGGFGCCSYRLNSLRFLRFMR